MCFVNSAAGGQDIVSADSCYVLPAIAVPFTNMTDGRTEIQNNPTIQISGGGISTTATVNPKSTGDEAGSLGGVASGTVASQAMLNQGLNYFIVNGSPVTNLNKTGYTNSRNTSTTRMVPSQFIVLAL